MTPETWGILKSRMEFMDGFPAWSEQMGDNYFIELQPVPDAVAEQMGRGVLKKFAKRPSVKELLDWSHAIAPPPPFKIEQICAPPSGAARLTGPASGVESYALRCLPPAAAKGVIERLRQRPADPENSQEWGLQFRDRASGRVSRTQPSYSRSGAERKAAERNEKWGHVETTVFHKGDPMPEVPAPRPSEKAGAAAEREMQAA